jgi:predicted methyltransferase
MAAGDHVLDLFAGGGWYTELLAKSVGDAGKVYAQNDQVIWRFAEKGITERSKNNRLSNVVRFDNMSIVDMTIPDESLDIAFIALNYHDMFFTHTTQDGKKVQLRDDIVDYKAALATIKKALKADGTFIIIDHNATQGSGYDIANTLHRIDPNIVKFQLEEAGFILIKEAHYLRNPTDDLNKNVFAPETRGKTDRFIYKFAKK